MERYSVFLTPARNDFDHTAGIIRELCAKYGGEPFEPHLTVHSGDLADPDRLKRVVSGAASETAPFSLRIRRVARGESFFRALYFEFEENSELHLLRERILTGTGIESTGNFVPHLSLLYGNMSLHRKQASAGRVIPGRAEIFFDEIKIVSPRNRQEGWRDTGQWQTLFSLRLGNQPIISSEQP